MQTSPKGAIATSRQLMIPAADTRLYAVDAPGGTPPLLFLSGRVGGLVLIDGAYPITMFDEAGKQKVRAQFRRLGWLMRIAAALGRTARMSPAESADVAIEMDAVNGELRPDFAALECPTVFIVGTGAHSGATEEEMRTVRAAADEAEAVNPRVSVFATAPHKHTQILSKAPDIVVAAIEAVILQDADRA